MMASTTPISAPLLVTGNEELVWERAIDVLHEFQFEIGRENRVGRIIETVPKTGSGVLEPWQPDSVGLDNRWESTLQSIRRIVQVSVQPDDNLRGYVVSVAAHKEIDGTCRASRGIRRGRQPFPKARRCTAISIQWWASRQLRSGFRWGGTWRSSRRFSNVCGLSTRCDDEAAKMSDKILSNRRKRRELRESPGMQYANSVGFSGALGESLRARASSSEFVPCFIRALEE